MLLRRSSHFIFNSYKKSLYFNTTFINSRFNNNIFINKRFSGSSFPKFGLGPRFEPYVPELKGEPLEMGEESEAEYIKKVKELNPELEYDDPERAIKIYSNVLSKDIKEGQVIKYEDEELISYTPEEYFGISESDLQLICNVVSGRSNERVPKIKTYKRLDHESFIKLLTLQSRKNYSNLAFRSLEIMKDLKMDINSQVYTLVISSCYKKEDIEKARKLFDSMLLDGIPLTVQCCTAMMSCYSKNFLLDEAYTLMRTYALGPDRIIEPDNAIFTTLIHGCMKKENYKLAWDTFDMMRQFYLEADTIAFTLMIDICARTYEAERAFNLFDEIKFLNLVPIDYTYNSMIKVCSRRFDYFNKGFEILREMKEAGFTPNAHTYHLLLSSCGPVGNLKAADLILDKMENDKIPVTIKTYSILLNVIERSVVIHKDPVFHKMLLERSDIIFKQMQQYVLSKQEHNISDIIPEEHTITTTVLNSYIGVYARTMRLRETEALLPLFDEFKLQPDAYTYTILIRMFSKARRVEQCFDYYRQMKQKEFPINEFVWRHLLNACAITKYYNNGFKILRLMIANDYEITPKHIHKFYRALSSEKVSQLNELKELVWPYPPCRVFFLRPPPAYPTHPEPPGHVRPGEIRRKEKGKRWKKKASNRKNKPQSK